MKRLFIHFAAALALMAPAVISAAAQTAGQDVKQAGRDAKAAGQDAGDAAKNTGKGVGRATKTTAHKTKVKTKHAVNRGASKVQQKTGDSTRQ